MSEVTYEIKKRIGIIAEHTRMSRGISMSEDEFRKLINLGKDWQ